MADCYIHLDCSIHISAAVLSNTLQVYFVVFSNPRFPNSLFESLGRFLISPSMTWAEGGGSISHQPLYANSPRDLNTRLNFEFPESCRVRQRVQRTKRCDYSNQNAMFREKHISLEIDICYLFMTCLFNGISTFVGYLMPKPSL